MLRSRSILALAAAALAAAAIPAAAASAPAPALSARSAQGALTLDRHHEPPREFVDGAGKRWLRVGEVTDWAPPDEGEEQLDTGKEDIARLSDEELAERLRPIALVDGWEYEAAEAPLQLARDLKSGRAELYAGRGEPDLRGRPLAREDGDRTLTAILGSDGRFLRRDNTSWPMSTHVLWRVGVKCSSTLIGRSTAVSVAHCFVKNGKWRELARWAPGVDSQDANAFPFGDTYGCYVPVLPKGYKKTGKFTYDYAVVEFSSYYPQLAGCPNQHPGDQTGWLGWWQMGISKIEASGRTGYVYGYPGEKANWPQIWGMGQVGGFDVDGTDEVEYWTIDTSGGQSGSGLYMLDNGNRYVVGAHQGSEDPAIGSERNRARRIDGSFAYYIKHLSAKGL